MSSAPNWVLMLAVDSEISIIIQGVKSFFGGTSESLVETPPIEDVDTTTTEPSEETTELPHVSIHLMNDEVHVQKTGEGKERHEPSTVQISRPRVDIVIPVSFI